MTYQFSLREKKTKELVWNRCMYYDVETAPWNEPFKQQDDNYKYLNIRATGITSFCLVVPKDIPKVDKLKRLLPNKELQNMVAFWYYNDEIRSNTKAMLVDALNIIASGLRKKTYLCGFNNSSFDDLLFMDHLQDERPSCLTYHLSDGKETKLYTTDLKYWCKAYGFSKLADIGEYLKLPKKQDWKTKEEYIEYNITDVLILVAFVKMLNEHGLYALRPATAARNLAAKELHEKLQLKRILSDEDVDRIPLIGGRTEPYYAIGKNLYYLDVNSLYPYVMANFQYPSVTPVNSNGAIRRSTTTCGPTRKREIEDFLKYVGKYLNEAIRQDECIKPETMKKIFESISPWYGILRVKLHGIRMEWKEYEKQILHYFPFGRKKDGYTLFSFDVEDDYWIQFYELMWLCFFDYTILEHIEYTRDRFPLADKIVERYELRKKLKQNKDSAEKAIKILLNTGYGIYATRNHYKRRITEQNEYEKYYSYWIAAGRPDEFEIYDDDYKTVKVRGDKIDVYIADPKRRYADNTVPIWAIATTSHARFSLYCYMLNGILTPPEIEERYRIFYVDTDSIFCTEKLYKLLDAGGVVGAELGQLKLEDNVPLAYFLAPKTYILVPKDGKPVKKFKGTGTLFTKTIVAQSLKTDFTVYTRETLRPEQPQKRRLEEDYSFTATPSPEPGTKTLKELYEECKKKYE